VGALRSLAMVAVAGCVCVGVGVGVGVDEGSADSSAPVIDWKPASSLAEVMVMVLRQMTAALVAYWVQCAATVLCCAMLFGSGECLEARESDEVRRRRGAQPLDRAAAAAGVRCRCRRAVASGPLDEDAAAVVRETVNEREA
jgi:hypothetical protein